MPDAEAAIRQVFQIYLDSYNRLEAAELAALHATPSSIVHRGQVLTGRRQLPERAGSIATPVGQL